MRYLLELVKSIMNISIKYDVQDADILYVLKVESKCEIAENALINSDLIPSTIRTY